MFRNRARRNAVTVPLAAFLAGAGLAVVVWFVQVQGWLW